MTRSTSRPQHPRAAAILKGACTALMLVAVLLAGMPLAARAAADSLAAGFERPPDSAKPHTWWHWLNGNSSEAGITADLEAMRSAGIGGVQIFNVDCGIPDGPVPVMSQEWREHTRHAIAEAARLGLEVCVHNCAGWSSSGGPWVSPEHAMQMLTWSEQTVTGPALFDAVLEQPPTRRDYYRDIAVFAIPTPKDSAAAAYRIAGIGPKASFARPPMRDPELTPGAPAGIPASGVVDITSHMDTSGKLTWDVPDGQWTVLRMGHTCTGAQNAPAPASGRGLEVDKLSREAMDAFWPGFMGAVIAEAGPLTGTTLNNALIDSYETGYQNWTPRFREEFVRLRGYDPMPYLPAITGRVVESLEQSERFLWDFRRTVADLWAANYYGYFAELCRKHDMLFSVEPYGNGGFDNLQCGGLADVPMGEFWVPNAGAGETLKIAASAAHTNARKFVGAESFTADERRGRWLVEPYGIKALGDYVFTQGINRYIFHRYAHQPWMDLYPGMTMGPWGTHLERTITWWDQASAWFRYIARCQYLLQSGKFVADACYFTGEAGPNNLDGRPWLNPQLPAGYDYDGCDATVVMNRMAVRNGRIVLPDGMSYGVLVLPDSRFMTPALARKIRDLVRAGATVIGPKPEQSPSLQGYPQCDAEVAAIGEEVWGNCDGRTVKQRAYGKGRVLWGVTMREVFMLLKTPWDFDYRAAGGAKLAYIHRRIGDAEVYFVSNQQYRNVAVDCRFRVHGKLPELWHPDTGAIELAPLWRATGSRTVVSLRMEPAASVFVVFRKPAKGDHLTHVARSGPAGPKPQAERIEVTLARYEAQDGSRWGDVTARVAAMVAAGQTEIPATNEVFGDPVPMAVKRLRVEYLLNGKPMQAMADEGSSVLLSSQARLAAQSQWFLRLKTSGTAILTPWRAGIYELRTAWGAMQTIPVGVGADELQVTGPWTVRFTPGWGAPPEATFPELASWTDNAEEGIRYYSGSATYIKDITVPASALGRGRDVVLDLGSVKNFAEVTLNGRYLGALWKAPFRVNVTGMLKAGENTLEIKVTNLWPNRLIGDEQLPPEVEWEGNRLKAWPDWLWSGKPRPRTERYTFTTWRFWWKDSELVESGLLGPVVIRSAKTVTVEL
ncbi:MAG: hypothetical protein JSV65_19750 [Armatimonadota bacterium]|nr:MAG: hypothetical protein JSV65_19750 [Armatimonadota bacterium]